MGICCSKKIQDPPLPVKNQTPNASSKNQTNQVSKEEKKVVEVQPPKETPLEKPKRSISEKPKKQEVEANITSVFNAPSKPEETRISTPVRTSSCTKEEVDAILIQCGRLSRSSSEKRKYSGSKRSFDFDNEKRECGEEEEELVQTVSRPSPRRRRTPSRERSGSKERVGSQSQRRVSRSPNRRNESEKMKQQQPTKMVSVPACEKAVTVENGKKADISNNLTSSNGNNVTTSKRNASPRSRSCENSTSRASNENNSMGLSRSNSRKGEQSPFKRNPMSEIDENLMKGSSCGGVRKANQIQTQCNGTEMKNNSINYTPSTNKAVPDQTKTCKTKEKQQANIEPLEQSKDSKITSKATRSSSRRSSRDLDNITSATNYTSLLLEDIQNYQQQNTNFSLPACVSKACSIMEAVADLNSSSSDQSYGKQQGFGAKDDDMNESSIQKKCTTVSGEPQESAGSNSYVGQQPWHSRNSVDSTERNWAPHSSNLEVEMEEEVEESSNGRRCKRGGGSTGSSHVSGSSFSSSKNRIVGGVRKDYLLPVVAAAAAASS